MIDQRFLFEPDKVPEFDIALYKSYKSATEKLDEIVEKMGLCYRFHREMHPISFEFFDKDNEDESILCFTFSGGTIHVTSRMDTKNSLTDKEINKLKTNAERVQRLWLQYWFSRKETRFARAKTPLWHTAKGDVIILDKNYTP